MASIYLGNVAVCFEQVDSLPDIVHVTQTEKKASVGEHGIHVPWQ